MWKDFVVRTKIEGAPAYQLYEMEMAFKCGCANVLIELTGPVASIPEEAGVQQLTTWMDEHKKFLLKRVRDYNMRDRGMN